MIILLIVFSLVDNNDSSEAPRSYSMQLPFVL